MPREPVLLEPTLPCPILPGDLVLDARSGAGSGFDWFGDRPKGGLVISSTSPRTGSLMFKMLARRRDGQLNIDERKFNLPDTSSSPEANIVRITLVRARRLRKITIMRDFWRFANYFYYDVSDEQEVASGVKFG